ncbi:Coatomer subunit zeta-1 [Merluccius polli]|uniref:Coatomer subunit zeta n=1 Tax=Merluccius polli TaxID=89951 RepID=A0AA47NSN6_MERPO|nr:Coatomer subunit zeta-1 [Merluccius polli]
MHARRTHPGTSRKPRADTRLLMIRWLTRSGLRRSGSAKRAEPSRKSPRRGGGERRRFLPPVRKHPVGCVNALAQRRRCEDDSSDLSTSTANTDAMESTSLEPSLYTVKALFILDNDGNRLLSKYYDPALYPSMKEQNNFEKNIFNKTHKADNEIAFLEGMTVVYKSSIDLFFYVVGSSQENELMLMSVLNCLFDSLSQILRKNVERRYLLDNMEGVFLVVDEIIDGGVILESDPQQVLQKVNYKSDESPLSEHSVAQFPEADRPYDQCTPEVDEDEELLESCKTGTTAQKLTNDLFRGLYDRDCLASHSISGLVNSKKGQSKPAFPADQIQAVLIRQTEIKGYIRQKLQNEAKRLGMKPLPLSTKEEEPMRRGEGLSTPRCYNTIGQNMGPGLKYITER